MAHPDEQIIESQYTFRLPERTASVTAAELGLPQDAYVIADRRQSARGGNHRSSCGTTGATAVDVPQAFRRVPRNVSRFLPPGTTCIRSFATARRFSAISKDVLAVYEHCDAYFNPPRYGGGSSAAFALAMGLPVLTRVTAETSRISPARASCSPRSTTSRRLSNGRPTRIIAANGLDEGEGAVRRHLGSRGNAARNRGRRRHESSAESMIV